MTDRGKVVARIIEGFKALANNNIETASDLARTSATAEDLLFALYKAGVANVTYTPTEKETIGTLVEPALPGLSYQLSTLHNSFSSSSIDSLRIQRSGLQFLIDTFKDFCADSKNSSEILDKSLREFVEREDLDGLDERLRTAEFDPYTDDGERSASLEAEIARLPSTHWWFFD